MLVLYVSAPTHNLVRRLRWQHTVLALWPHAWCFASALHIHPEVQPSIRNADDIARYAQIDHHRPVAGKKFVRRDAQLVQRARGCAAKVNTPATTSFSISGSAGKAQFGGGGYRGSLDNYVYAVIQELAGNRQLPVPPPHVTLYVAGRAEGIGVSSALRLKAFVVCQVTGLL